MKNLTNRLARFAAAAIPVAMLLAPAPAVADKILSVGAGGVVPWEGDGGYSILGSLGFTPFSEYTRLALEFEYRNQDVKVGSGSDPIKLPVDTYDLRAVFRFVFNPGGFTPYLGFGAGLKLISVDDRALKRAFSSPPLPDSITSTKSYGVSGGLLGLLGLEFPLITDRLAIFAEARFDYAWEFTDGVSGLLNNGHAGAFVGAGGLRLTF